MATFFDLMTVHDGSFISNTPRPRQRITRACDQCHQLRTRCDGQLPCSRCVELGINCEYLRKPKKRGQGSWKRKNSPHRGSAAGKEPADATHVEAEEDRESSGVADEKANAAESQPTTVRPPSRPTPDSIREALPPVQDLEMSRPEEFAHHGLSEQGYLSHVDTGQVMPQSPGSMGNGFFPGIASPSTFAMPGPTAMLPGDPQPPRVHRFNGFPGQTQSPQRSDHSSTDEFLRENGLNGTYRSMWSPSKAMSGGMPFVGPDSLIAADMKLRYPVLAPLMPHLINIISTSLATTLLESYFLTFTGSSCHPLSPYLQTFIFRRTSILHPTNPRECSPALVCSMLWLAAQTSEAPALTDGPSSRTRISQKLLELTIELLKPLRHQKDPKGDRLDAMSNSGQPREPVFVPPAGNPLRAASENTFSLSSSIDHIVTYMHLGTVCSASEHKGSSIRWWSVAWAMARDMKLNREIPRAESKDSDGDNMMAFPERMPRPPSPMHYMSEDEREERRRIWWALYMIDRHLSLCYNQPLTLLDVECEELCLPLDERLWQQLDSDELERLLLDTDSRMRGPQTKCYDMSIFGYFLPLMTIMGGIIDLIRARNHPRFGRYSQGSEMWDAFASEIRMQLDDYQYSLEQMSASSQDPEDEGLQQRIATAYGTHLLHVMHILLTGKWDPVNLLDDDDHWVSTQGFANAAKHATSAAEAISAIFDDDFDLSFMPWFWGIYLLQGSFLLLLVAERLQKQTTPAVLKGCENIVRAHEACVVTLDNEYQRNFRKIMISAIAQVKGRRTEDQFVQQQRRREVLSLYRWTGSGGGLVL